MHAYVYPTSMQPARCVLVRSASVAWFATRQVGTRYARVPVGLVGMVGYLPSQVSTLRYQLGPNSETPG